MYGEHTDLSPSFLREIRQTLTRRTSVDIDALAASALRRQAPRSVRLDRDATEIRRAIQGSKDLDVLTVAMHLISATEKAPKHLAEVETAFKAVKPVSKLGNRPDDLKELQAGMRGYLNNDTRKQIPTRRLFANPKRGFWGLPNIGDRRASDLLRRPGMIRG
jgi:hypothetical protein